MALVIMCGGSFCTSSEASQYSERPALSMAALSSTLQLSQKVCALGLFSLQQHARFGSSTPKVAMIEGNKDSLTPLVSTLPHSAFQEKHRCTAHSRHMKILV